MCFPTEQFERSCITDSFLLRNGIRKNTAAMRSPAGRKDPQILSKSIVISLHSLISSVLTWDKVQEFHNRLTHFPISFCPGSGQERVNFHQKAGGITAGRADPNWPNKIGYWIPCAAVLGSGGGSWPGERGRSWGA